MSIKNIFTLQLESRVIKLERVFRTEFWKLSPRSKGTPCLSMDVKHNIKYGYI